MMIN